tara:strand:+ start:574 stop:1647 length:1074 start_codon:yes stop_codon:yes gene_type:complete
MAGVATPLPLLLQGPGGRRGVQNVEGYSVSPTVAVITPFLVVAHVALAIAPSPYVFATMTNLCYLAAGFWREAVSATERHTASLLVGQMAGGALVLVFMGASSLAFHRTSTMNSPAHTLDIVFGWVLVSHVFYVSFSVALLAGAKAATSRIDRRDREAVRNVRFILSVLFLVFVTVLMTLYDDFYRHQTTFYLVVGPAAAVFGAICRGILVYEEGKLHWPAVRLAIVELVVALTAVFAAIVCQGELLGRTLSRATTPEEYDFYHGHWHFLLALVVALLYSRAADSARIVQGTHRVCVCSLPTLDWAAELLLLLYAVLCLAFKEGDVDLGVAKGVLGAVAGLFAAHSVATLHAHCLDS